MTKKEKLALWQARLASASAAWANERERMDAREALYRGTSRLEAFTGKTKGLYDRAYHVRNITIETMIRNELDRLPMEEINDLLERMVPIQGGGLFLVEWDQSRSARGESGELAVSVIHPKQIVPQDGVTGGIDDMDYIILSLPQTKAYIRARYGVDADGLGEDEPGLRGAEGEIAEAEDIVTQYLAYYRGEDGAIGLFSWCGDQILEDLADYQARFRIRCASCGAYMPAQEENAPCPSCGAAAFEMVPMDCEEIYVPIRTAHGTFIPGAHHEQDENGESVVVPTRIPSYKPGRYPLVLQKNVSVYGRLLGDSDVDIKTALNAGMFPLGVSWGYRDRAVLEENGAGDIAEKPSDIVGFILK